jgi:predicted nucleotidyltransferase
MSKETMKKKAVEWLVYVVQSNIAPNYIPKEIVEQAKEMEKNDTDNKVIHFAEWLTKKHTSTLITLYEHFEEEYYNETFKSE